MLQSRLILASVLAAAVLLTAPVAHAANTGLGFGIHGGYGQSSDAESGSPLAGAHVIINLTSWLGAVGMVDYKFEEDFQQSGENFTVTSLPLTAMGRFYLPVSGNFSPYAAAGVQYRIVNYDGDLFSSNTELDTSDDAFGWLLGAGVEFSPSEKFEWFLEARFESADPDSDIDNAIQDAKDLNYDQWNAILGITWFLN